MTIIEGKILFDNHLILDYVPSWPKQVTDIISLNKEYLLFFIKEESRIDKLAEENVQFRCARPFNPYQNSWDKALKQIHEVLKDWKILGFHASRLLEHEMDDLLNNGFQELTWDFVKSRIEKTYQLDLITMELRDKLISKEQFKQDGRLGKVFFFHTLSSFNGSGLTRLFKSWGGESMYHGHEENSPLQHIGKPCIVVASLDIFKVERLDPIGERLISIYLRAGEYAECCDTDSCLESHGDKRIKVLSIIEKEPTLFDEIAKASSIMNS